MQIIQSKSNFVEKIFRDKAGRLVRAEFCVYENEGRIKARLVNFKYLDETTQISGKISGKTNFLQLGHGVSKSLEFGFLYKKSFVSPYFTFETLNFIGSKPRAPTFS